jgi:hypothetical protein
VLWTFSQLPKEEQLRVENIIDMGISWSTMLRVFEPNTKRKLRNEILRNLADVFESPKKYIDYHAAFCEWGMKNIKQNKRFQSKTASYGQIAKTLDVTLKVAIYYCYLPDYETSREIRKWLYPAVDTNMMDYLQRNFNRTPPPLPNSIEGVDKPTYEKIQSLVCESMRKEGYEIPSQWEDIYYEKSKLKKAKE